jgi:hypothetical protein
MTADNDIISFFREESTKLEMEFKSAKRNGSGTPNEISDFQEGHFNQFISKMFPFPYKIKKGQIRDSFQNKSNSIDCIVINPIHPHVIEINDKFSFILADGVDSAIELKPSFQDKKEFMRGLKQLWSVKKLQRVKSPIVVSARFPEEVVNISKRIPTFLFGMTGSEDPSKLCKWLCEFDKENNVPLIEQIDYVILNNQYIIANIKHESLSPYAKMENIENIGYSVEKWKEDTLAAFIYRLSIVYHAQPTFSGHIFSHYLNDIRPSVAIQKWIDD